MKKTILLALTVILGAATYAQDNFTTGENWGGYKTRTFYTGDDCDKITIKVTAYWWSNSKVTEYTKIPIKFRPGGNVTWWKKIAFPVKSGGYPPSSGYVELVINEKGKVNETQIYKDGVYMQIPIKFYKAKFLGIKTELPFTIYWNDISKLWPIDNIYQIEIVWEKDTCN